MHNRNEHQKPMALALARALTSAGAAWPPDESGDYPLPCNADILADHLAGGDEARLFVGDIVVHVRVEFVK